MELIQKERKGKKRREEEEGRTSSNDERVRLTSFHFNNGSFLAIDMIGDSPNYSKGDKERMGMRRRGGGEGAERVEGEGGGRREEGEGKKGAEDISTKLEDWDSSDSCQL